VSNATPPTWTISHDSVTAVGTPQDPFVFKLAQESLAQGCRFTSVTFLVQTQTQTLENPNSCWNTFVVRAHTGNVLVQTGFPPEQVEIVVLDFTEGTMQLAVIRNNRPLTLGILLTVMDGQGNSFTSPDPQIVLEPRPG
jgi:hypothetical protein